MRPRTCFAFDLDGTITQQELLPLIASALNLEPEMKLLTELTISGAIPFEASFRLRCAILRSAPLEVVRELVASASLDPAIEDFIKRRKQDAFVVTGNLDVWVEPLIQRLGCRAFTSRGVVEDGKLIGVGEVLRKSQPVLALRSDYERIVAVGESVNDLPMFEAADIRVAFGGVHPPVPQIIATADYAIYDGSALCRLLDTL